MFRSIAVILIFSIVGPDCWQPIVVDAGRNYVIKNEGKLYKPLYLENDETIESDLVIDTDSARVIRMGTSISSRDTVIIKLFDNEVSYAHSFDILLLKGQFLIRYHREINFTDLEQRFETVKSKLELNTLDLSKGSKIRGHVEYTGKCTSGCSDKNKRIRIAGNFAVKIYRY